MTWILQSELFECARSLKTWEGVKIQMCLCPCCVFLEACNLVFLCEKGLNCLVNVSGKVLLRKILVLFDLYS